jgi:hypothetical protein
VALAGKQEELEVLEQVKAVAVPEMTLHRVWQMDCISEEDGHV